MALVPMVPDVQLIAAFLDAAPVEIRERLAGMTVAGGLRDLIEEARLTWPDIDNPEIEYVRYVAERLPLDREPAMALAVMRGPDLWIACACTRGERAAIAAFDARLIPEVSIGLARMRLQATKVDEVKQLIRQKLFVTDDGSVGRIKDYSGRGDLRRWIRSIAVRTALNEMRRGKREILVGDDRVIDAMAAKNDSPEMAYMKERYRHEFREAFLGALQSLNARDQNLLRYHHVDNLNIDEIGAIYRVHRVTAYRWLEKAREALVGGTQRGLQANLKVEKKELDSILQLIRSQLHLSLVRYLGEPSDESGGNGDSDGGDSGQT